MNNQIENAVFFARLRKRYFEANISKFEYISVHAARLHKNRDAVIVEAETSGDELTYLVGIEELKEFYADTVTHLYADELCSQYFIGLLEGDTGLLRDGGFLQLITDMLRDSLCSEEYAYWASRGGLGVPAEYAAFELVAKRDKCHVVEYQSPIFEAEDFPPADSEPYFDFDTLPF